MVHLLRSSTVGDKIPKQLCSSINIKNEINYLFIHAFILALFPSTITEEGSKVLQFPHKLNNLIKLPSLFYRTFVYIVKYRLRKMNSKELQLIIKCGETSTVQFKERFPNQDSIAAEMVAMSNARGGE